MNCVEKYRGQLIRNINQQLRVLAVRPEETAVHEFRVGMKRLRALFYFLDRIDSGIAARRLLKPYRPVYKAAGLIRDAHIATALLASLDGIDTADSKRMLRALQSRAGRDYRAFKRTAALLSNGRVRVPTITASGISARLIQASKPIVLNELLQDILPENDVMSAKQWHQKRILLKRYHHIIDAFQFCPGHARDESELKQIRMLEQLLGDWHDRVVTTELLQSLPGLDNSIDRAISIMNNQDRLLLGSAKIYLHKFGIWHGGRSKPDQA